MVISKLQGSYGYNGKCDLFVDVQCQSTDDVDELISWLRDTRRSMIAWKRIYETQVEKTK